VIWSYSKNLVQKVNNAVAKSVKSCINVVLEDIFREIMLDYQVYRWYKIVLDREWIVRLY